MVRVGAGYLVPTASLLGMLGVTPDGSLNDRDAPAGDQMRTVTAVG